MPGWPIRFIDIVSLIFLLLMLMRRHAAHALTLALMLYAEARTCRCHAEFCRDAADDAITPPRLYAIVRLLTGKRFST
jgi:hypothetical protein